MEVTKWLKPSGILATCCKGNAPPNDDEPSLARARAGTAPGMSREVPGTLQPTGWPGPGPQSGQGHEACGRGYP